MPDPIPTDDLYERLGVRPDADTAAIDRAWRALLKRHHPDVAGLESLEAAKRINVAHDWLADPVRRARYDAQFTLRVGAAPPGTRMGSHRRARSDSAGRHGSGTARARPTRTGADADRTSERDEWLDETFGIAALGLRAFLRQIASLTPDDLDRLSVADPHDIAPSLRRFVPPELWLRVDAIERLLLERLPPRVLGTPAALNSARSFGHALVLEFFVAHQFADPDLLIERMRRGWESAVGQPRYGPNGREVQALIERIRTMTPADGDALAAAWAGVPASDEPWPRDAWEYDYAALEVSAALARRDAAAAADLGGVAEGDRARQQAAFARTAHVVALRPIFPPREYARLQAPWAALVSPARQHAPMATVRRA